MQHATTEMLLRLEEEYRLGKSAATILMSLCVEYDIGNVVDPAFTMVCKMPKSDHLPLSPRKRERTIKAIKLVVMVLENISKHRTMPVEH